MRASLICLLSLAFLSACRGGRGPEHGAAPPALWDTSAMVPADTPYVMASLTPAPAAVRQKMAAAAQRQLAQATKELAPMLVQTQAPWARALQSILAELRTQPLDQWWQNSGFADGGRFVLYGLSVWPVVRIEVSRPAAVRDLVQRTLAAAGQPTEPAQRGRWQTWQLSAEGATLILAVTATEVVAAALPSELAPRALPWILGEQRAPQSLLEAATLPALARSYGLSQQLLTVIDLRAVLAILAGSATGVAAELAPAALTPALRSSSCVTELGSLVELMPRVVFGYQRFDAQAFAGSMIFEMPPRVTARLGKLTTAVSGVSWPVLGKPLFAMAAALDMRELGALLAELSDAVTARPFACPELTALNEVISQWHPSSALSVLPPLFAEARGFELVIEEYTAEPTSASGHLSLVSRRLDTLPGLLSAVPGLPPLSPVEGAPFDLGLDALGLDWLRGGHGVIRGDKLVAVVGADSQSRALEQQRLPTPKTSPLLVMAYDVARMRELSEIFASNLLDSSYREAALALEVMERGLRMQVMGTW